MWPITHSSPTTVGTTGMQWMTEPSWIDVRAPMRMPPLSPRSTAHGPDRGLRTDLDVADDDRIGVDEGVRMDAGLDVAQRVEGHRPRR